MSISWDMSIDTSETTHDIWKCMGDFTTMYAHVYGLWCLWWTWWLSDGFEKPILRLRCKEKALVSCTGISFNLGGMSGGSRFFRGTLVVAGWFTVENPIVRNGRLGVLYHDLGKLQVASQLKLPPVWLRLAHSSPWLSALFVLGYLIKKRLRLKMLNSADVPLKSSIWKLMIKRKPFGCINSTPSSIWPEDIGRLDPDFRWFKVGQHFFLDVEKLMVSLGQWSAIGGFSWEFSTYLSQMYFHGLSWIVMDSPYHFLSFSTCKLW